MHVIIVVGVVVVYSVMVTLRSLTFVIVTIIITAHIYSLIVVIDRIILTIDNTAFADTLYLSLALINFVIVVAFKKY